VALVVLLMTAACGTGASSTPFPERATATPVPSSGSMTATPTATAQPGQTPSPTASPAPSGDATPAPTSGDVDGAQQAVIGLYAGMGNPRLPGTNCIQTTSTDSADFSGCPVTARLAARLDQIDGVGAFPLFADSESQPSIAIGSPFATTAGATVRITFSPNPPNPIQPVFIIDAVVISTSSGWAVDNLYFYGEPGYEGVMWLPGTSGGPWSVYDACWTWASGDPGATC